MELIRDRKLKKVKGVMSAMMQVVKLDVAVPERAYEDAWQQIP